MAQSVVIETVLARARKLADVETSDQANSIVTDAELLDYANQGYRSLYDLICTTVAESYFATSASVGPSSWAMPSGFYRLLGVDFAPGGITVEAQQYNFRERNRDALFPSSPYPRYRLEAGSLVWKPSNPTAAVTVWYIPTPSAIAAAGTFDAFNGWDDYIVHWVVREIKTKQEESVQEVTQRIGEASARIRRNAAHIVSEPDIIADTRGCCDATYYNS